MVASLTFQKGAILAGFASRIFTVCEFFPAQGTFFPYIYKTFTQIRRITAYKIVAAHRKLAAIAEAHFGKRWYELSTSDSMPHHPRPFNMSVNTLGSAFAVARSVHM